MPISTDDFPAESSSATHELSDFILVIGGLLMRRDPWRRSYHKLACIHAAYLLRPADAAPFAAAVQCFSCSKLCTDEGIAL